jgi:hypothetical protein
MSNKYYEDIFGILSYKGNANQNSIEILSHLVRMVSSRKQTINAGKDVG